MSNISKISVSCLIASVIATVIIALKVDSPDLLQAIFALVSISLFTAAFFAFNPKSENSAKSLSLLAGAEAIAIIGGYFSNSSTWVWAISVLAVLLVYLSRMVFRNNLIASNIIIPLLFALSFLATAAMLGNPGWGGYPAAFAFFFSLGLMQTHRLETYVNESSMQTHQAAPQSYDYHHHHQTLSWTSMIFFLFGLITLWPWLGKLYSDTYFWALIIGVHAPLVFLWGRLRQPKNESAFAALKRFNLIMPYVAFVLLLALVIA